MYMSGRNIINLDLLPSNYILWKVLIIVAGAPFNHELLKQIFCEIDFVEISR